MAAPSAPQTAVGSIACPTCGHANLESTYFCVNCHATLIHRCPACWHEQRQGGVCEKCGTNFALYGELQIEHSMEEESRVSWDRFWASVSAVAQILLLPFSSLGGVIRSLVLRVIAGRLSNR